MKFDPNRTVSYGELIETARAFTADHATDPNPEYVRGQAELIADAFGDLDARDSVAADFGVSA